jgi:alkylation response protein AidB-like acyl-CoA dehydrogenase
LDFCLSEEQQLLRKTVREFAEAEIAPNAREWDEKQEFPRSLFGKLGELGLMGVVWPAEYGGAEMTTLDYALVMEELARADAGVALSVAAHNSLCSGHIFLAGTQEQKKKYLVPLAKGEKVGCWGLTENSAGSDAGGTKTTAVCDGGNWVLNGSKTFITNGRFADVAVVMAVTDKSRGKKGISAFVVERGTPGFRAGKKEDKLGVRSSDTSELVFEDCRVPVRTCWASRAGGSWTASGSWTAAGSGSPRSRWASPRRRSRPPSDTRRAAGSSATRSPSSRRSSSRSPTWRPRSRPPGF